MFETTNQYIVYSNIWQDKQVEHSKGYGHVRTFKRVFPIFLTFRNVFWGILPKKCQKHLAIQDFSSHLQCISVELLPQCSSHWSFMAFRRAVFMVGSLNRLQL